MPPNFTPQVANGGAFVPYQPVHLPSVKGNAYIHPWVIPPRFSPQVIDVDNNKVPQDRPQQNFVPVDTEVPAETKNDNMGPSINMKIHPPVI